MPDHIKSEIEAYEDSLKKLEELTLHEDPI